MDQTQLRHLFSEMFVGSFSIKLIFSLLDRGESDKRLDSDDLVFVLVDFGLSDE